MIPYLLVSYFIVAFDMLHVVFTFGFMLILVGYMSGNYVVLIPKMESNWDFSFLGF